MPSKLVLLDFDGTLCLGDDPVLEYARTVDEALGLKGLPENLPRPVAEIVADAFARDTLLVPDIEYGDEGLPTALSHERSDVATLRREDRGNAAGQGPVPTSDVGAGHVGERTGPVPAAGTSTAKAHPNSWPLQDGYQLVQLLAVQAGLSNEEAGTAFRAARRQLVGRGLQNTDLHAPEGAAELLAELRAEKSISGVLITNAPAEGFAAWLEALGLQDSFDAVLNSAQKPFGMPAAVEQARAASPEPVPEENVLSVGDIWANDLAHVRARGGSTILIDRFDTGLGEPAHRVGSFAEAAPLIRRWSGWKQFS
ncbi:HAD family hydrolase [Nesterenkonia ebinurensis]|uniref:HAD family hydrolase n=1 Tax=Nesterenkonia ebinurensis TaxID=2608252 RepID=UPI00168AE376|nr:HAD family hydrolase [Nesterenkonia ebinurensis]